MEEEEKMELEELLEGIFNIRVVEVLGIVEDWDHLDPTQLVKIWTSEFLLLLLRALQHSVLPEKQDS